MKTGKLIVFEGIDGSGKTTQAKLLYDHLKKEKVACSYISFPRYQESLWGKMVRKFLDGEFGKNVDPYLSSVLYAGDRLSAADSIKKWIDQGKIVICDRYVASNLAHMSAKFQTPNSKLQYVKWLEKLEYGENKIPEEDLVIFLSIPVSQSIKLMKGRKLDIHESNSKYLEEVERVYEDLANNRKKWVKVEEAKNGKILTIREIHQEVIEFFKKKKII